MIKKAAIIPTGDEIVSGIVLDTDSPAIMGELLGLNGGMLVLRMPPVPDSELAISGAIQGCAASYCDVIVLIGGSGEGHRHSDILGRDVTRSILETQLEEKCTSRLYGKNGHLWSELVIGRLGSALVFNVPGPYEEALAVTRAFTRTFADDSGDLQAMNDAMRDALRAKYGG